MAVTRAIANWLPSLCKLANSRRASKAWYEDTNFEYLKEIDEDNTRMCKMNISNDKSKLYI